MVKVVTNTATLALISLISIGIVSNWVFSSGAMRNLQENIYVSPTLAGLHDSEGKLKGIEEKSDKQIGLVRNPSTNRPYEHLDSLVQTYIDFHNSAIEDGRVKDGFRYVIYACSGKEKCGGVGDRVLSMIKAFYFAMITHRVLLIDSQFPTELKKYLNPNFVQWDAEFQTTEKIFDDMDTGIPISHRYPIDGYLLKRCNGPKSRSLTNLLEDPLMKEILEPYGYSPEYTVSRAIHQAFWALFKFDDSVLSRAEEMKHSARLGLHHFDNVSDNHIEESSSSKGMVPYIGLHSRQSDSIVPGLRATGIMPRETNSTELLTCYQHFLKVHPDKYQAGYLASNDPDMKNFMKVKDPTILFDNEVNIFHVDLSTRTKFGTPKTDTSQIHQGVIDAWAEVAVLVDSDCLIMSRSMFAFLAHYIRDETMCSVYISDCNENTVTQKINKYSTDPFHIIYQ